MDFTTLKPINLSSIEPVDFPVDKYYPLEYQKKQIVLHHTISNNNSILGDIDHWLSLVDRIATCIIVDGKGTAHQCFSSRYWAHHLGVTSTFLKAQGFTDWTTRNIQLNQNSISLEIDNWGGLILGDDTDKQFGLKTDGTPNIIKTISGKFYAAYGNVVNVDVQEYPNNFRGYKYFEKYNEAQIKTVGELLLLWHIKYGIPLDYQANMWDVSNDALLGKAGVWSHVSFRPYSDKSDCHPDAQLITMLKTLKSLT